HGPTIELQFVGGRLQQWRSRRFKARENLQHPPCRLFAVRRETVQVAPYDATTKVLIEKAISRRICCRRNTFQSIVWDERLASAILKQRRVQHNAPRRQMRNFRKYFVQRQLSQVCESEAILVGTKFFSCLIEELGIELRFACNDDHSLGLWMQLERKLKCRRELPL